jgi:hypothetical protein
MMSWRDQAKRAYTTTGVLRRVGQAAAIEAHHAAEQRAVAVQHVAEFAPA